MTENASTRESDDNYKRVIVTFGKYRLIDGSCGIEWVIKVRDGSRRDGTPRWTGRSYARRREATMRLYRTFCVVPDRCALALVEQLPDWHRRWGAHA